MRRRWDEKLYRRVAPGEDSENYDDSYEDIEDEVGNVELGSDLLKTVEESITGISKMDLIKDIATLLKEEGGLLEKSIGNRLDNNLIIAGEVILKRLKPIFRRITLESMEENRLRHMRLIKEYLDQHPLVLNKEQYGRALKLSEEDLLVMLTDISYDPYGRYSMIALIAAAVVATFGLIYAIMNCWYNRRQGRKLRKKHLRRVIRVVEKKPEDGDAGDQMVPPPTSTTNN